MSRIQIILTPSQQALVFTCLQYKSFENTVGEKEKLLIMSNFSFSHNVFCPFGELSTIFIKFEIVVWKLFQFGSVLILLFGKGLTLDC